MCDRWLKIALRFSIAQSSLFNVLKYNCELSLRGSSRDDATSEQVDQTKDWTLKHRRSIARRRAQYRQSSPGPSRGLANSSSRSAIGHSETAETPKLLLSVEKRANLYYGFISKFQYVIVLSHIAMCMLRLDLFAAYRFLDCFLVGRFCLFGHTNRLSILVALILSIWIIAWRLIFNRDQTWLFKHLGPRLFKDNSLFNYRQLRLYALEFLLYDFQQVMDQEAKFGQSKEQEANFALRTSHFSKSTLVIDLTKLKPPNRDEAATSFERNPIFYIHKSPSKLSSRHKCEWILRPNRTAKYWSILAKFTKWYYFISVLSYIYIILIQHIGTVSNLATVGGFELTYTKCVEHIVDERRLTNQSDLYSAIYSGPLIHSVKPGEPMMASDIKLDEMPFIWPYENFVPLSPYHATRLLLDFLVNYALYFEYFWSAAIQFHIVCLLSLDVVLNALEIKRRTAALVEQYNEFETDSNRPKLQHSFRPPQRKTSLVMGQKKLRGYVKRGEAPTNWHEHSNHYTEEFLIQIYTLQNIIQDHSHMIKDYNAFVSLYLFLCTFLWFPYSAVICTWMLYSNSRAVEVEFVCLELIGTVSLMLLFALVATAHSHNTRIYKHITTAMALDKNYGTTKLRWARLSECYYPKSLFCFSLADTGEISWLFCLQFGAWSLSALSILSTFIFSRRM